MRSDPRLTVIDHFEKHLGQIETGWAQDADGVPMPFQVIRMPAGDLKGYKAFATLGLGRYLLKSRVSSKIIQHELLLVAPAAFGDRTIPGLLHQVGSEAIRSGQALLCGDVIGPRGSLFAGTEMQALYVAMPVYFPDALATYKAPTGDQIVVAWLVPITTQEATYVRLRGWEGFEEAIARLDPDLGNPERQSMSLLD